MTGGVAEFFIQSMLLYVSVTVIMFHRSDQLAMRLPAFVCLSVIKITQKRVHGFG